MTQVKKAKKGKKVTKTVTTTTTTTTFFEGLKTRIAILLDSSGSMQSISREAVDMFNEQVRAIRKGAAEVDTKVSLVTFASEANAPLFFNTDVSNLKELDYDQYNPNGGTAMYDAIGTTIDALKLLPEANEENTSFLMVIISDGQENASKKFNSAAIAERVKSLQDGKRWTFSYLGANQDLTKVSQQLGFFAGNMMSFNSSSAGVNTASVANSGSTANYMTSRSLGVKGLTNFYDPNSGAGGGGQGGADSQGSGSGSGVVSSGTVVVGKDGTTSGTIALTTTPNK
jgi:uncharacterized protein YegL